MLILQRHRQKLNKKNPLKAICLGLGLRITFLSTKINETEMHTNRHPSARNAV